MQNDRTRPIVAVAEYFLGVYLARSGMIFVGSRRAGKLPLPPHSPASPVDLSPLTPATVATASLPESSDSLVQLSTPSLTPSLNLSSTSSPTESGAKSPSLTSASRRLGSLFAPKFAKLHRGWLLGVFLMIPILILGALFFGPELYFRLAPPDTVILETAETGSALGGEFAPPSQESPGRLYEPPLDENLPLGDWVVIPQIGVRTEFLASDNPDEALTKGAWLAPTYGRPGESGLPIILAAHRFGWTWWWQSDFWKYHSFYRLPETNPGTQVEIISGQRKWLYEIYAGEESDNITDYNADLILYTCKHLNSPVRFIRYARLVKPG